MLKTIYDYTVDDLRKIEWDEYEMITTGADSAESILLRAEVSNIIFRSFTKNPYHIYSEDPMHKIDASETARTDSSLTYVIEYKYRHLLRGDARRERYNRDGWWLERTKYDALMEAYYKTGSLPCYYVFLPRGEGYAGSLKNVKPEWKSIMANDITSAGLYGERKRPKEAIFLPIEKAKIIKW